MSVLRFLLKDPRVDITLGDKNGITPLWCASYKGNLEVIEWLISSGRDVGYVENKKGKWWGKDYTALEIARKYRKTDVVALLKRFITNPALTRHEVRGKFRVLDKAAAEVFALTVCLCDDLLRLRPACVTLPPLLASSPLPPRCHWSCRWCSVIVRLDQ